MPSDTVDAYLAALARISRGWKSDLTMVDRGTALASIAISLRRIADAMERMHPPVDIEYAFGGGQTPIGSCSVCSEPQFDTPFGVTCKNGHGGADSASE